MYSSLPHALLFFITYGVVYLNAVCIPYFGECNEDCDCCGWPDADMRCELRSPFKGNRCHLSRMNGGQCDYDRHCKSQYCLEGTCTYVERPIIPPQLCNISISDADPIKGNVAREEDGLCPCPNPNEATKADALKAIDGDLSTVYVNNYALNAGLIFHDSPNAPLYNMTICSASDCTECDPTCYKLEGFCPEKQMLSTIQEGSISFHGRNECIVIPITNRAFFSQYSLTFPCQRGGFTPCSSSFSAEQCRCSNGIVPFEPPVATKQSCNGATPVSTTYRLRRRLSQDIVHVPHAHPMASPQNMRNVAHVEYPVLTYVGKTKVGDITEIVYILANVGGYSGFAYAIIQWSGSCCFDCYNVYKDVPTNGVLDETDEQCGIQCQNVGDLDGLLKRVDDPLLCMQGIKLHNDAIFGHKNFFFKVKVHGDVRMEMKPYGMATGVIEHDSISYGDILSPVCASCGDVGRATCQDYPLQVAEVSLSSKCKDIL